MGQCFSWRRWVERGNGGPAKLLLVSSPGSKARCQPFHCCVHFYYFPGETGKLTAPGGPVMGEERCCSLGELCGG